MNLSCGNCKAIRSFSGQPLKCDVCGWVCDTSIPPSPDGVKRTYGLIEGITNLGSDLGRGLIRLLIFSIVAVGIGFFVYLYVLPVKTQLSIQYDIPESKVIVDPKPHGCAYDDAPLGNKHCHYEKQVDAARACSECPVTAVYVSWRKVEE